MSIYTEGKQLTIDSIEPTLKTLSVLLWDVVCKDGVEIARNKGNRRAFVPGDIDALAEWIEGCSDAQMVLEMCSVMWTPEVVAAYEAALNEAQ